MKLTITIDSDNAGMQNGYDAAAALRNVVRKIETAESSDHGRICDVNGNVVGTWSLDILSDINDDS